MSLVGNLEDLSLGDILQILSLSQKSGVLSLQTEGGEGRIVFVGGLVCGAAVDGHVQGLRSLLVEGGFLDEAAFDAAVRHGEQGDLTTAAAIDAITDLSTERIDSLCRESVEVAVIKMFCWQKGDFSFDVRTEPVDGDPELLLVTGMNAQYLAMEAARMRDESGPLEHASSGRENDAGPGDSADQATSSPAPSSPATDAGAFDAMSAEEMFGVTAGDAAEPVVSGPDASLANEIAELELVSGEDLITAADALAVATLKQVEAAFGDVPDLMGELESPGPDDTQDFEVPPADSAEVLELEEFDVVASDAVTRVSDVHNAIDPFAAQVDADSDADEDIAEISEADIEQPEAIEAPETPETTETTAATASTTPDWDAWKVRPVVVIDESLPALEWVKAHLRECFAQVHIFQRSDQGLARIRQYLVRGAAPILLVAPDIRVDHLSGLKDARDFVDRLKAQSRKLEAIWLVSEDANAVAAGARTGAALRRPSDQRIRSATASVELEAQGQGFADLLGEILAVSEREGSAAVPAPGSAEILSRLRDTTRLLGDASSGGEILPLVIRFARETFARVAMFMVRDDVAQGLGQSGLDRCGGPDDEAFRRVRVQVSVTGWMHQVVESRSPVNGPPSNEGDRDLSSALGDRAPKTAYCAAVESAGQVVALLYADNLPDSAPVSDTSALEVVLHHAGLALDRAALERALVEESHEH